MGFAIQVETTEDEKREIILRFDTSHGYVHQHLFSRSSAEVRSRLQFTRWKEAYTYCLQVREGQLGGRIDPISEGKAIKDKEMINKNLDLHYHLMMQLLDDPDSLDIPDDADVILLPEDDPELRAANLKMGEHREKAGATVVYVNIRLVPETRTVLTPELTVVSPAA